MKCMHCKWWYEVPNEAVRSEEGQCRKYAPKMIAAGEDDFCGEFKEKG